MFITKKHLSRRTVLRGVGTALALPLLDAMVPARTALAQTAANAFSDITSGNNIFTVACPPFSRSGGCSSSPVGYSAGGEAWQPLGLAVVGGLLFSQLITLYLTPVFYTYMEALVKKLRRKQKPVGHPDPHVAAV